jgi:hypothetical protein
MTKRKLYYVPGLISLLGLPILLHFWGPTAPKLLTVAKIIFPSEDTKPSPSGSILFSKWYLYQSLKLKKIVSVDLNDDRRDGNELGRFRQLKKLDFISNEIARRQFTHDTTSILKVQLGDDCTYGDFFWVLNQAKVYDVRRFAFVDDAYFLFSNPPQEPVQLSKLDLGNDVIYVPQEMEKKKHSGWEIFKAAFADWWKQTTTIVKNSSLYVTGFFLFIIFPAVLSLRKNILLKRKKSVIFKEI